jgi:c-di-GMP-binding flagellar brake protein YcgR
MADEVCESTVAPQIVWEQMTGQPVRVSVLDPTSRERLMRLPGVLAKVDDQGLTVECLQAVGSLPDGGPVTVEVLAKGQLFWFHAALRQEPAPRGWIYLTTPTQVQNVQRRRHHRVDVEAPVTLVPLGEESHTVHGVLRDISASGAALRAEASLPEGKRVQVAFSLGSGLYFNKLEANVVRCSAVGDGWYVLALHFDQTEAQQKLLEDWVHRQMQAHEKGL